MNQIYACRKGREIPFTDTTSISTVPTAKRSGSRTVFTNLFMGCLTLSILLVGLNGLAQTNRTQLPQDVSQVNAWRASHPGQSLPVSQQSQTIAASIPHVFTYPYSGGVVSTNAGDLNRLAGRLVQVTQNVGRTGPSTSATSFAYSGAIVPYVVPAGVTSIRITAVGAGGGNQAGSASAAGSGASMTGNFTVTPGQVLNVLVGQTGQTGGVAAVNGGGGGSFVTTSTNTPLVVAGGGGGSGTGNTANKNASLTTSGNNAFSQGLGGSGGNGGNGGGAAWGSGGGLSTDATGSGGGAATAAADGRSFLNGGAGGTGAGSTGGFGGGGAGSGTLNGGGGGGYSGGGGNASAGVDGVGGGGGSFNSGSNTTNALANNAGVNGSVSIAVLPLMNLTITGNAPNGNVTTITNNVASNGGNFNSCDPATRTYSGFSITTQSGVLITFSTSGNVTGVVPGTVDVSSATAAATFTGAAGPYTLTSGTSGTITRVYQPYYDQNNDGDYDPGVDDLGPQITTVQTIQSPIVSGTPTASAFCSGSTATINVAGTPGGGTYSYTFITTPNVTPSTGNGTNIPVATPITQVFFNTSTTNGVAQYTITYTTPAGCTANTTTTITIRPNPEGVIINSGGQSICAGNAGQVNVFLTGSPVFNGQFQISVINGIGSAGVLNWTSPNPGGPQAVNIPAGSLTNTSQNPTTYRISWNSLSDNNPGGPTCAATPPQLQGFEDIVVYPTPTIAVTPSQATINATGYPTPTNTTVNTVCPGTTLVFNVTDPSNTVGATYNYVIKEANGNTLAFANGQAFGAFNYLTPSSCTLVNPVSFTFTPQGPNPLGCQGAPAVRQFNILDNTFPTFTTTAGSLNTTVDCGALGAAALAAAQAFGPPAATDNCGVANNIAASKQSGAFVAGGVCPIVGTYTNKWFAQDACGNSTAFVQTITVRDITAPTFTSGAGSLNTTIEYCTGNLTGAQNLTPTATDFCSAVTITKAGGPFAVGSCPTRGTITNIFTATDVCGNSTTFTQVITITDNTGPVITGANTQTLNIGAGANCQVSLPNYINGTGGILPNSPLVPLNINDCASPQAGLPAAPAIVYNNNNSGPGLASQSPAPGTQIIGAGGQVIPVTITATDACGNTSTFTVQVTLLDQTAPVARCHNVTVTLSDGIPTSTLGNTGTASLTPDQVNGRNDNTNPGNGTAPSGTPAGSGLGTGTNPSTDNCSPIPTPPLALTFSVNSPISTRMDFSCANVGINNITLVVTDASGNSSTCPVQVTVVDATKPTFTCPGDQPLSKNANCIATVPNYQTLLGIVAKDNCTPSAGITWTQTPAPGTILGAGVTTQPATLVARDANGNNSLTCNFNILVQDNLAPIFTCTPTTPATTGPGNTDCAVNVTYVIPTATDNCQGPGFPNQLPLLGGNPGPGVAGVWRSGGPASGSQFFVGTTPITYTAQDASNNSSTCTFNVVVTDNTIPTVVCTANKSVSAGAGCTFTYNLGNAWNPAPFDNCLLAAQPFRWSIDGGPFFSANNLNGVTFNLGNHNVCVTVTDASNNTSAPCCFTVAVVDNAVPSFSSCPSSFTITTATGPNLSSCRINVPLPVPTTTQNCTTVQSWFITALSGGTPNSSGIGAFPTSYPMNALTGNNSQVQVQYRLDDANGNSTTCTYTVTVQNVSNATITGNATVAQNVATTSTVTFTGISGTPNYCFTYETSFNGGPFALQPQVCTTAGQSVVTVAQSNAVVGQYTYHLLSATDANGCALAIPANPNDRITINVVPGTPDLTTSQFFTTTQIAAGGTIDEVIVLRNVGTAPTLGTISFTITNYSPLTGLTVTQTPAGTNVTIGIDTYTISAGWTFNAGTGTFTSTNVIPAGGSNNIGIRITRGTNPNQGANGNLTQTTTVAAGTGGGETPSTNNTISNTITKI